jgi:hypothetical protein
MDTTGVVVIVILSLILYFLPSILGSRKRNAGAIIALNLLLGWIVALVWSLTHDAPKQVVVVQAPVQPAPPQGS